MYSYKSVVAGFALLSTVSAQSALLSAAEAQQSIIPLWLIGFDRQQTVLGSVVGSDAKATTYSLACGDREDSNDCGIPTSFLFTQGPSTLGYTLAGYSDDGPTSADANSVTLGCDITNGQSGMCSATIVSQGNGNLGTIVTSTTLGSSDLGQSPVTLTAGLGANAAQTATGMSITSNAGGSAASQSGATATKAGDSGASPSGSAATKPGDATASKSSAAGAAPMITGNAQWMVGGAAAAAAVALAALQ